MIGHRYEPMRIEPRHTSPYGGVDHGSSGRTLIERLDGNTPGMRLVWFKATRTASCGVRGFGHVAVPTRLSVLKTWGMSTIDPLRAGRLSIPRLMTVADQIDAVFGAGATALIDLNRTLIVVHPSSNGEQP